MFLQFIDTHFSSTIKLHEIFNRKTVEVRYSCTQNISQIIKKHDKKVMQIKGHHQLERNCRIKTKCRLNGYFWKEAVIYVYSVNNILTPKKYLGLAEVSLKSKDIITTPDHFEMKTLRTVSTFLSIYGWKIKKTDKETPALVWK